MALIKMMLLEMKVTVVMILKNTNMRIIVEMSRMMIFSKNKLVIEMKKVMVALSSILLTIR